MKSKQIKHSCGVCLKNVTKNVKAVLCKDKCAKWFHLKCTELTAEDYGEIKSSKVKWSCGECNEDEILDMNMKDVNELLEQQLQHSDLLIKSLHEDLIKAQEEIQKYKDEKVQLEHLLLLKVEEIVKLENKIVEFEKKSEETYATVVKKKLSSNRLSLPSNHILSARLSNSHEKTSTKTLSEQAFSKCKKTNPQEKYKKKTKVEITEKNIFSNNIYDVLRQDNDDNDEVGYVEDLEPKGKILICSDSHGKDLAWHLNNKHSLNSVGFVRPGGRAEQILNMDNINGEVVSKEDFLVIMCGTNDVARNEAEVLINNITNTLESVKEKKVILVDLPNRYDLAEWSCVNKETRKTNLVLKELSNGFGNVSLVEASVATKDMHTKHGMHFNAKGKDWLAGKIDEAVKSYSTRPPSAMDPSSAGEPSTEDMLQPTVETLTGNVQPPLHGHRIEEQTDSTHPNP